MMDAGADLEAKNDWEGTALAEAVWNGKQEVIPILLARSANPNVSGQYGTPLCLAIDKWDTIAIRMLLEDPRTDANLARRDGTMPIHLIPYSDNKFNPGVAEALIKRGAAINTSSSQGKTPLMRCCWTGAIKWADFLVKHGADIRLKNANGETAYEIAAQRGQLDIMKILEERGGKIPVLIRSSAQGKIPLTDAQRWALATGAVLNQRNGQSHEALIPASFTGTDRASAIRVLKEDWGVNSHAELIEVLALLENRAEETQYLAWMLCRCVNIAQWGVQAGYLKEDEAWEGMLRVANRIQETFKGWAEMSDSYLAGRRRWYRNAQMPAKREAQSAQPQMEYIVQMLLNPSDPNSPWTKNKWDTNLRDPGAPLLNRIAQQAPEAIPAAPTPIVNDEWKSAQANCAVKIPPGGTWKPRAHDSMSLTMRNETDASFHLICLESKSPEITPAMAAKAKANSKANDQVYSVCVRK